MLRSNTLSAYQAFRLSLSLYLVICLLVSLSFGCKPSEEGQIREVCSSFISGRIALRHGDSSVLKSVTEDSLFKLLMLNEQYIQVVDVPTMRPNLDIYPKKVTIEGNRATCRMSGDEFYLINLVKQDDRWMVKGENEIYASADKIAAVQEKIRKYKLHLVDKPARDSVMRVVNIFFRAVQRSFKENNFKSLASICDPATVNFIQKFFDYAKQRTGVPVLSAEMDSDNFLAGDVSFNGNLASFKFYQEAITIELAKVEDDYVIIGFNHMAAKNISRSVMEKRYLDLLRSMKFLRQKEYRNQDIR